jgi:hypothetical protein
VLGCSAPVLTLAISKPQTPNPKPQTPNPEPRTPNPEPRTPNPEPQSPSTSSPPLCEICVICGYKSGISPSELALEVHHFLDPFLNQPWAVGGGGPESEEREGRLLEKIVEQLISQTPVGALMG